MDTFFFIRIEGQFCFGPYLSFNEASTIMMDHLPEIVSKLTSNMKDRPKKYKSQIVERVLEENRFVDVTVRATDIRVLEA